MLYIPLTRTLRGLHSIFCACPSHYAYDTNLYQKHAPKRRRRATGANKKALGVKLPKALYADM